MSRWAQRRRTGGGGPNASDLITILEAEITGNDTALVTFSAPVDATDFSGGDFISQSSGFVNNSQIQVSPEEIELTFEDEIAPDFELEYVGAVAGIQTPQTVNYT